jgi:hypothetical protein
MGKLVNGLKEKIYTLDASKFLRKAPSGES